VLSTLPRYLLKRWTYPLLGALFFYGGLILAWEMVVQSKQIFSMGAPFRWIIPALLTQIPETLGMVFPMAAVLGGLLGSQHLSEGSEMVASQGLGVGMRTLVGPWLIMSLGLVLLTAFNSHWIVPQVNGLQRGIQARMLDEAQTRFLKPGSPPLHLPNNPNAAVWIDASGEIHFMESGPQGVQHLVAESMEWARLERDGQLSAINVELKNLSGSLVQRSNGSIVHIRQKTFDLAIPVASPSRSVLPTTPVRYLSTRKLMENPTPQMRVELGLRFSLPIATCALLLLGVALGLGHPRFQRGGAILKSLGVILVYYVLIQFLGNQVINGKAQMVYGLVLLPWLFLALGTGLLWLRLRPHRSAPGFVRIGFSWVKRRLLMKLGPLGLAMIESLKRALPHPTRIFLVLRGRAKDRGVLARWTRGLWWRNWGATLGTFLTLSLLLEFAQLAGDLSKNKVSIVVFLQYWAWNLPPFLVVVLPIAFLFGSVLALSEATISREWVALRAGGTSLLQWILAGVRTWSWVLALSMLLQVFVAPASIGKADALYNRILNRPSKHLHTKPWLYLGSTGVLWYLEGPSRWGFPLKPQGQGAPVLLKWRMHDFRSQALPWNALGWVSGPEATELFPDQSLRDVANAEEASTPELFQWQRWAPDPERSAMLWGRLLNWLAGPCLLFSVLPFAFPTPRGGRGQALGISLVAGLLFMGAQALFMGAARAGEIPGFWGVAAPLAALVGLGLLGLQKLRT